MESGSNPSPNAPLPLELKKALRAFKKRLKLTKLDDESKLGVGPMSGGSQSRVFAIRAPDSFPPETWKELVRWGRLRDAGSGTYELVEI